MKKRSEATQTLRAGCKADPQTNKQTNTNKHTDRGDYNTLCSFARSVTRNQKHHLKGNAILIQDVS